MKRRANAESGDRRVDPFDPRTAGGNNKLRIGLPALQPEEPIRTKETSRLSNEPTAVDDDVAGAYAMKSEADVFLKRAEWLLRVNLCLCDDQQALPASTQLAESPRAFSLFGSLTFKTGLRKGNTVRQSGAISRSRS